MRDDVKMLNFFSTNLLLRICSFFLIFSIAFITYHLLFYILGKIFQRESLARRLIYRIKKPARWIFFEMAAITTLFFLDLGGFYHKFILHILIVLLIALLGWTLGAILKTTYIFFHERTKSELLEDISKRSAMTQLQFLYRGLMFLIIILTLASILLTFPIVRSIGIGIIGSAGIAGIALGIAARPILLNLMAGFQIAMTKVIKIGDMVNIQQETGRIEHIFLTHVVIQLWDLRRMIFPISYFIDSSFQNWSSFSTSQIGAVFLYCDYTVEVGQIRKKFLELIKENVFWDGKTADAKVTEMTEKYVQIRLTMSARNPTETFELKCEIREKMIDYLIQNFPHAFAFTRMLEIKFSENSK
jgi:small-conductance mechanosensitive channel